MRRSISYRVNQIDTAMLKYNKEPLQTSLTMPKLPKLASIAEKSEKAVKEKNGKEKKAKETEKEKKKSAVASKVNKKKQAAKIANKARFAFGFDTANMAKGLHIDISAALIIEILG